MHKECVIKVTSGKRSFNGAYKRVNRQADKPSKGFQKAVNTLKQIGPF